MNTLALEEERHCEQKQTNKTRKIENKIQFEKKKTHQISPLPHYNYISILRRVHSSAQHFFCLKLKTDIKSAKQISSLIY